MPCFILHCKRPKADSLLTNDIHSIQRGIPYHFVSLANIIPKYFFIFEAIVSGIIFLIFLSYCSLLVDKYATGFCVLALHPANFLNLLVFTLCVYMHVCVYVVFECVFGFST